MGVFIKLCKMSVTKVGAKILVALAFMAFANVAFADSESLQKLFNEYNVGKDKQEEGAIIKISQQRLLKSGGG